MRDTKQELTTALLRLGRAELARLWRCTDADMRLIHRDEIQALNLLAARYLDRRRNGEGGE